MYESEYKHAMLDVFELYTPARTFQGRPSDPTQISRLSRPYHIQVPSPTTQPPMNVVDCCQMKWQTRLLVSSPSIRVHFDGLQQSAIIVRFNQNGDNIFG